MKRNFCLGLLIGMLTLNLATAFMGATEVLDRIVAVVNEEIILLSELEDQLKPYAQRIRRQNFPADKEREMLFKVREEMLNRLVDEKLTDQEVKRLDIKVSEAEIDSTIERIKTANSFTDEDLRQFLEQEQLTLAQYRDSIKDQVLRTRLVNFQIKSKIVITEEEIRSYYDSHPELYGGKVSYQLRNILMRPPDFSTAAEKRAIADQMQQIRSQIEAGESFADLAGQFSQSPAAEDGGYLGEFEKETLSPQIRAALDGLVPGQTTTVLDTDLGFQLFYVEAINQGQARSLESARAEIHQKLFAEVVDKKFISWLEELRSQSHIKVIN